MSKTAPVVNELSSDAIHAMSAATSSGVTKRPRGIFDSMMGNIAGGFSPLVVGYLLAWTANDWTLTFYISSAIYLIGGVCWLFLDSHTSIEDDLEPAGV